MMALMKSSPLLETFFEDLRSRGFRLTALRRALVALFATSLKPLTIADVQALLRKKGHRPNVTSIYREIAFLVEEKFIRSVKIAADKAYYEFWGDHHHHIVCRVCGKIEDVDFPQLEKIFPLVEKKLKASKTFRSIDHSLEFFGVCAGCM